MAHSKLSNTRVSPPRVISMVLSYSLPQTSQVAMVTAYPGRPPPTTRAGPRPPPPTAAGLRVVDRPTDAAASSARGGHQGEPERLAMSLLPAIRPPEPNGSLGLGRTGGGRLARERLAGRLLGRRGRRGRVGVGRRRLLVGGGRLL